MYPKFIDNNLISSHRPGFKGDSFSNSFFQSCMKYINLLMKVLKSVEYFLISLKHLIEMKMWQVVWRSYIQTSNSISGKLHLFLKDFSKSRKQLVVLNGQHLSWRDVNVSVAQGSILGFLLFVVYINDLSNGLKPKSNASSWWSLHEIPEFHLISWYGNFVEWHSFRIASLFCVIHVLTYHMSIKMKI